jgi:hypothetical protein
MKPLTEITSSPDLCRNERLFWRFALPLGLVAAVGTTVAYSGEIRDALQTDYGCATTEIQDGSDATAAALAARQKLGLPTTNGRLDEQITQAAAGATGDSAASLRAGTEVTTCVDYALWHFGSAGWDAKVTVSGGSI